MKIIKKNLKILHINNPAFVAYNLCKLLRKKEIDANLLIRNKIIQIPQKKEDWIYVCNDRFDEINLCKLNLDSFDLIHLHYLTNITSFITSLKKIKTPIILHAHGSDTRPKNIFIKVIQRLVARKSNILLYSTPDLKENLNWFKGRLIYLPNPIEVPKKIPKIKKYNNRILIFTTLNKIKKIEKIFSVIKNINYQFDIIDVGPDKNYYKKIAPKNTNFIKPIKKENIKKEILKYPLIIGGSQDETIRVCELEAMSLGIPTLFPFKYNNFYPEVLPMPEFTANNIKKYSDNHKLGEKQKEWTKKYHEESIIINKLVKIYKKILQNKN